MPNTTHLKGLSPFYGGVGGHFRVPPYLPPLLDSELEQSRNRDIQRSFKCSIEKRSTRLLHSLDRDLVQFVERLTCDRAAAGVLSISLLAYRILARCKLLADAHVVSSEPDDDFEALFHTIRCGANENQDWINLETCMGIIVIETNNAMLQQHFAEIWNVLQPFMRAQTPQHWLALFFCAWRTPCDDWPPFKCWSYVKYARRIRNQVAVSYKIDR
ncbi:MULTISPECIES: hypothetical protein [unclassified Methylobacterium]|uniref:hypothetical protein n=1 Tax=unclassified Methylobacterium TaxID=2615210 RepID=UPI0012E35EB7|nr:MULTISPECIES: hypothetical protein [unclassified Methylobacterium]